MIHRRTLLVIAVGLLVVGQPADWLLHSVTAGEAWRETADLAGVVTALLALLLLLLSLVLPPHTETHS